MRTESRPAAQKSTGRLPVTVVVDELAGETRVVEAAPEVPDMGVSPELAALRAKSIAGAARLASVPVPHPASTKYAPRFAPNRQPVEGKVDAELDREGMRVLDGVLRCCRQDCAGGIHLPDGDREAAVSLLKRTMTASGWQQYLGKWFCSKRCVSVEAESPAATLADRPVADPKKFDPKKVVLDHGVVLCSMKDCGAHVPAHGLPPDRAIEAAVAGGFVQTVDGVFCSREHARHASKGKLEPIS